MSWPFSWMSARKDIDSAALQIVDLQVRYLIGTVLLIMLPKESWWNKNQKLTQKIMWVLKVINYYYLVSRIWKLNTEKRNPH